MKLRYLFIIFIFGLLFISCNQKKEVKIYDNVKTDTLHKIKKINLIFIISNPNIKLESMNIDQIIDEILVDSLLKIEQINTEFPRTTKIIKVYKIEDITCPYLKSRFDKNISGELVFEYNGKILVKLNDGIIKIFKENHQIKKYK